MVFPKPWTIDCEPHSVEWFCTGFWKSHSSFSVHTATAVAGVLSQSCHSNALLMGACAVLLLHKDKQRKKDWIKPRMEQKHMRVLYCLRQWVTTAQGFSISQHMFQQLARWLSVSTSDTICMLFVFYCICFTWYCNTSLTAGTSQLLYSQFCQCLD